MRVGDLVQWRKDHKYVGVVVDTCVGTPNVVEIYWLNGRMKQFNMSKTLNIISQVKKQEETDARDI